MNPASVPRAFRLLFQRGQVNQPDMAFPQSPGIIPGTFNDDLLITAACSGAFNELITVLSNVQQLTRKTYTLLIHRSAGRLRLKGLRKLLVFDGASLSIRKLFTMRPSRPVPSCEQLQVPWKKFVG